MSDVHVPYQHPMVIAFGTVTYFTHLVWLLCVINSLQVITLAVGCYIILSVFSPDICVISVTFGLFWLA